VIGGVVGVVGRAWLLEGRGIESAFSSSALRAAFEGDAGLSLTLTMVGGLLVVLGARAAFRPPPKLAVAAGEWGDSAPRLVGGSLRNAWLAVVGVVVIAIGAALDGHSASEGPRALVWAVDLAHMFAAGMWFGGLALLGALLVWRWRAGRSANAAYPAVRFSTLAGIGLGVAALAGVLLAVIILPDVAALWETNWGRLLIAKVALVAVVAGLGAYNHFRLIPRLSRVLEAAEARPRRRPDPEPPLVAGPTDSVATLERVEVTTTLGVEEPEDVSAALRKNAAIELVLLGVVVVLTAILVGSSAL
jgi:copper transport protein